MWLGQKLLIRAPIGKLVGVALHSAFALQS
jgi:hypothetical protein